MVARLGILVAMWLMTLVTLLLLDRMGAIEITTSGSEIPGTKITFKAAGAAAFVIVFPIILLFIFSKIRPLKVAMQGFADSLDLR